MLIYTAGMKTKNGVGFLLHPEIASCILDIHKYSDRKTTLTIKKCQPTETYIHLYSRCNDNDTNDEKDEFYNKLSEEMKKTNTHNTLFIPGYLKGKVGNSRQT